MAVPYQLAEEAESSSGGSNWLPAAMFGSRLAGMFGGDEQPEQRETLTRFTNPLGKKLLEDMIRQFGKGQGDFGFGGIAKQGTATLADALARRGINRGSGVALRQERGMLADASARDTMARRNFLFGLGTASPGTASGHRFVK